MLKSFIGNKSLCSRAWSSLEILNASKPPQKTFRRVFSVNVDALELPTPPLYEDEWLTGPSVVHSQEFYNDAAKNRQYFYVVDSRGRLFLEDVIPKNIATSLKTSMKFFWSQLRPPPEKVRPPEDWRGNSDRYYYSPCGKEHNWVRAADSPLVATAVDFEKKQLLVGGETIRIPMEPHKFVNADGRLYCLCDHKRLGDDFPILIASDLVSRWSESQVLHLNDDSITIQISDNESYPVHTKTRS